MPAHKMEDLICKPKSMMPSTIFSQIRRSHRPSVPFETHMPEALAAEFLEVQSFKEAHCHRPLQTGV